jgi:hypothetical protein
MSTPAQRVLDSPKAAPARPGTRTVRHVPRTLPVGLAVTAAGLAVVASYVVLAVGVLPLPVILAALAVLLVVVPTAGGLSRRVALNGSLLIGWAQVLWWVRWPVALDHGAVVVAGAVGFALVMLGRPGRDRASVVPKVRPVDSLLLLAGIAATTAMSSWAFAGSSRRALTMMLPGADNYAHFHMFATIRTYGAVTTAAPSPGGKGWAFDEYPQGFHALAATLSELLQPHLSRGVDMPLAYSRAVSLVVVLAVLTMTAAVISLPGLCDRPLVAAPVVALTCTAYLWKPGQQVLADGVANFRLAAAATATALLLGLGRRGRPGVAEAAAVGGLVMLVANAWAPMTLIAAPALPALLSPLRRTGHRLGRRRTLLVAGVLVVAALGVLKALVGLVMQIPVGNLVSAAGGVHGANPLPPLLLLVVGLLVCVAAPRRLRGQGAPELASRVRWTGLALVAGVVLATGLLVAQLQTVGTSSYYFVKLYLGFFLVLAAVVPAICGLLAARWRTVVRRPAVAVALSLLLTIAATQAFGRFPSDRPPLSTVGLAGTASVGPPFDAARIADGIMRAVDGSSSRASLSEDYVAIGRDRAAQPFYPDGWYHGMLASLTAQNVQRLDYLRMKVDTVPEAVPVVRRLLQENPGATVVVAPDNLAQLRQGLHSQALQARVRSWKAITR